MNQHDEEREAKTNEGKLFFQRVRQRTRQTKLYKSAKEVELHPRNGALFAFFSYNDNRRN